VFVCVCMCVGECVCVFVCVGVGVESTKGTQFETRLHVCMFVRVCVSERECV